MNSSKNLPYLIMFTPHYLWRAGYSCLFKERKKKILFAFIVFIHIREHIELSFKINNQCVDKVFVVRHSLDNLHSYQQGPYLLNNLSYLSVLLFEGVNRVTIRYRGIMT